MPFGNVRKQAAEYRTQKAGECIDQSLSLIHIFTLQFIHATFCIEPRRCRSMSIRYDFKREWLKPVYLKGESVSFDTVSYTHLDVYKRQTLFGY